MNITILAAPRTRNSKNEIAYFINSKYREILRDTNKSLVWMFDTLVEALYEPY